MHHDSYSQMTLLHSGKGTAVGSFEGHTGSSGADQATALHILHGQEKKNWDMFAYILYIYIYICMPYRVLKT